jgi:hypothetical protein
MFPRSKTPTARKAIDMYERIADKITKFVLDLLKKEKMLEMALNGEARPGSKRLTKSLSNLGNKHFIFVPPTGLKWQKNKTRRSGKVGPIETYDSEWVNKKIRNVRPRWFQKDVSLLEIVIQKMLDANSPAHKAQATRALNKYSKKRAAEIGSTPKRVVAGVKAAVTKRIKSKGSNTCSTN